MTNSPLFATTASRGLLFWFGFPFQKQLTLNLLHGGHNIKKRQPGMNGLDKVIEYLNHAHLDALLNPPTDDMILEHLKKEMGHIPADYIEFLKRCNGLTLYHSGDYCLFDAQEILSFHFSNDDLLCRSAWKIGYWMGYDIVINVDDIEKEYLYAGDCCSTDEFVCVGNILNFIEEIVKNGGDPYWTIDENQYRDFSKNNFKVKYFRQLIRYRTEDGIARIVGT